MKQYEFRLLNADDKAGSTLRRECETDEAAISLGRALMAGHHWVEIWQGPRMVARFPRY